MNEISLTSSMRANLLALQDTSALIGTTQKRLATGLKVNSALDNPSSYYAANSLNNRAGDLSVLLDAMGQGIQTIKAATEGVDAGIQILEQMRSVTEQALQQPVGVKLNETVPVDVWQPVELTTRDISEFEAEGYSVITADMTADDIYNMIEESCGNSSDNIARVVLAEDIVLDEQLYAEFDCIIDGNGHTLSFTTDFEDGAIYFDSSRAVLRNININYTNESDFHNSVVYKWGGELEISSVNINCKGDYTHGILAENNAKVTIDTTAGIHVDGKYAQKFFNPNEAEEIRNKALFNDKNSSVYNGRANTDALLKEIGADALAATAANQFYVGSKTDAHFGQGKWYLPAIGEWAEAYGTDTSQIDGDYWGRSGATGDNIREINKTLAALKNKGVASEELGKNYNYYWSSSEVTASSSWYLDVSGGSRFFLPYEDTNGSVRFFQLLENCFNPSPLSDGKAGGPKIGDVMYTDLSYGSAEAYDNSKTAAGVVTWVSEDGKSAKIMNLKDLSFSSYNTVGKFNPDNPYNNTYKYTYHTTSAKYKENVEGIADFTGVWGTTITIINDDINGSLETVCLQNADVYAKQFNELLEQYDMLVGDSTYKGINLLNGDALSVIFNEDMSSRLNMSGNDIRSAHIGLGQATWEQVEDVQTAAEAVSKAILQLRDVSFELGNSYSIIQNRQDFTQSLINVLTEGADNLALADMNEEAANMLALQTRQQLGVTALNLSSQSARSVLNLFQS